MRPSAFAINRGNIGLNPLQLLQWVFVKDRELEQPNKGDPMADENAPNKAWFVKQIDSAGLTARKAAAMIGLAPSLFSKRLSGGIKFTAAECADLALLLKVPVEDVMRNAGISIAPSSQQKAPLDGIASETGAVKPAGRSGPRSVDVPAGMGSVRAITIAGGLYDGWTVLYAPSSSVEPEAVGSLAVVTVSGQGHLLGWLGKGRERGRWTVKSMSGELAGEDIIATSAAPVLWVRP